MSHKASYINKIDRVLEHELKAKLPNLIIEYDSYIGISKGYFKISRKSRAFSKIAQVIVSSNTKVLLRFHWYISSRLRHTIQSIIDDCIKNLDSKLNELPKGNERWPEEGKFYEEYLVSP